MFTILSLIITVAAFNIISSLFMLVKDKTSDIAILRTMGASTKQIMLIFIYNGMFIGLLGTTLGVILGVTFSYNIQTIKNYLERITGTKIFEAAIYFFIVYLQK
ncbi:ftsX-like permease family protein [Rickettsia amblyommatis str. Darkwater]|nr:ftsX-like permease family protein [Rickettsia amblyommatis str. Darkwater]